MATRTPRRISLALQGGGSHGAFTWGVLDRLLEDGRLEIDGISGTSSGAMNAVALADGLVAGGREAARERLSALWTAVGESAAEIFAPSLALSAGTSGLDVPPGLSAYLDLAQVLSPAALNPLGVNPLRHVLTSVFDFERLRAADSPRVFVSATQLRTGKLRVFRNDELSVEVLLASACLPALHHTIEIDGEPYWDGGYSGNPTVFPLVFNCEAADVVVVLVQPLRRESVPTTVDAIRERVAELAFNGSFLREMRAIATSKSHIGPGRPATGPLEGRLQRLNVHLIESDDALGALAPRSRLNALPGFLGTLREAGRNAADAWLAMHLAGVGRASTVDLMTVFA